jgi:hypothetical protein
MRKSAWAVAVIGVGLCASGGGRGAQPQRIVEPKPAGKSVMYTRCNVHYEDGVAEVTQGVTEAAVETALCPPPPPTTSSLDARSWIYRTSRVNRQMVVFSNGDYVSRVEQ